MAIIIRFYHEQKKKKAYLARKLSGMDCERFDNGAARVARCFCGHKTDVVDDIDSKARLRVRTRSNNVEILVGTSIKILFRH